ncbi:phosphatase PAP2 family protein [Streptococcus plurextorum]|uniref:phosphatase PAP2 family protein n=1 Tax=Streptococcus plurextorum TaxID=456876 RepID=UPI000409E39B|nr:phosphatase PAP2 family protein [Streptococcus plurextorum]
MKQKQTYFLRASFAILIFVFLGYVVAFYPQHLEIFDTPIQTIIRGQLPSFATQFFKAITIIGNTSSQIIILMVAVAFLLYKKYYSEGIFLLISGMTAALAISSLKYLYGRPRPSISHLVHADGFSFPSGHSMGSMMILGSLIIIIGQRIKHRASALLIQSLLASIILLIGLSRIYLGVHYPTDVIAGFVLGYGVLNAIFPFYDQKRFEWRFQNKQK